jgi:hypothetical protein
VKFTVEVTTPFASVTPDEGVVVTPALPVKLTPMPLALPGHVLVTVAVAV